MEIVKQVRKEICKKILNPNWQKKNPFPVSSLLQKLKSQAREQMEQRRPNLIRALRQMGDFYMELKWDFQSWGKIWLDVLLTILRAE